MPRIKHGASNINMKLYRVFNTMKQRTTSPGHPMFHVYGGRGIKVGAEWAGDPLAFVTWALANGYRDGLSIDRIDNDGPYSPANCRWADAKTQARNTQNRRELTFRGETRCVAEWAEVTGIPRENICCRLDRCGWSIERALTEMPIPRRQYKKRDHHLRS
jgi:hypothetical protein